MKFEDHIERAEGYLGLGMHIEAWNELEELPPIDRVEPLVIEIRLRIVTALEKWELGESLANLLVSSSVEPARCKETCARFYHRHAISLCETGDHQAARLSMWTACDAWPEIRMELVDDKLLAAALEDE